MSGNKGAKTGREVNLPPTGQPRHICAERHMQPTIFFPARVCVGQTMTKTECVQMSIRTRCQRATFVLN